MATFWETFGKMGYFLFQHLVTLFNHLPFANALEHVTSWSRSIRSNHCASFKPYYSVTLSLNNSDLFTFAIFSYKTKYVWWDKNNGSLLIFLYFTSDNFLKFHFFSFSSSWYSLFSPEIEKKNAWSSSNG